MNINQANKIATNLRVAIEFALVNQYKDRQSDIRVVFTGVQTHSKNNFIFHYKLAWTNKELDSVFGVDIHQISQEILRFLPNTVIIQQFVFPSLLPCIELIAKDVGKKGEYRFLFCSQLK